MAKDNNQQKVFLSDEARDKLRRIAEDCRMTLSEVVEYTLIEGRLPPMPVDD